MSSETVTAAVGLQQNDYLTGTSICIRDFVSSRRISVALLTVIAYDYGEERSAPLHEPPHIGLIPVLSVLTLPTEVFARIFDETLTDDLRRLTTFGSADYGFL